MTPPPEPPSKPPAKKTDAQRKAIALRNEAARVGRHPHLVLTLRRTGGTSLMTFLARISPFPTVEHEPFNKNRMWGPLAETFKGQYDSAAFMEALDNPLTRRPNIKHCLDVVPLGLSKALISACHARGYQIFVLTRRNEMGRLRSLYIAQTTGVWGQEQAEILYPAIVAGTAQVRAIEPQTIAAQAKLDAGLMADTRATLAARGVDFGDLVFEDIYSSAAGLRDHACAIAAKLGVTVAPDDARLAALHTGKGLSASAVLPFIDGIAEVEAILAGLSQPQNTKRT